MRNNRYTQAVDGIKAPELAVEKAVRAARDRGAANESRSAKRTVSSRKVIRYAVAAVLVLVLAVGAFAGPGMFGGKGGGVFTVTAYAAELTKDSPVCVEAGGASMNTVGKDTGSTEKEKGGNETSGTEYYVALPFEVTGEHVTAVTYSADKDAIAVICPADSDPVTAGNMTGEGSNSLFVSFYSEQAAKAGTEDTALLSRNYSSVTLDAGRQAPAMALVGESGRDVSEFYGNEDKEAPDGGSYLEERAARLNELVGTVIRCTVAFDDGTEQQVDIQVSFAVMKHSEADPGAFAELTPEEAEMKDGTGVFVVYSIA